MLIVLRVYVLICYAHSSEARRSRKLDRIAIWNKSKTIYAISMTIWFADLAALLYGKYLLHITSGFFCMQGYITGAIQVNFQF
jgi:hypothetical protein